MFGVGECPGLAWTMVASAKASTNSMAVNSVFRFFMLFTFLSLWVLSEGQGKELMTISEMSPYLKKLFSPEERKVIEIYLEKENLFANVCIYVIAFVRHLFLHIYFMDSFVSCFNVTSTFLQHAYLILRGVLLQP